MKTQNTIAQLRGIQKSATDHAVAMESIANQFSDPTFEKMRRDAAHDARSYAATLRAIIHELCEPNTEDAAEMARMMMRTATKLEKQGWEHREYDWKMELIKDKYLGANAWRTAAHLLATENDIDLKGGQA